MTRRYRLYRPGVLLRSQYDTGVTIERPREPIYRQLAAILRAKLESNEIGPGEPLPSEATLHEEYDVSRETVRAALQVLRDEGWVVTYPTRGSFRRS